MAIKNWSTTAGNNTSAPPNGAPEGWSPASVNNTVRQIMADVRSWYEDAQWIDYGHTPTKIDSDTFTVSGDQTAIYDAGRRIKFTGSVSGYATISSSSYSAPNTTVNVTASSWTGTLTAVAVGIVSGENNALPPIISKVKTADQGRSGVIVLADDTDLVIPLEASTAYEVDVYFAFYDNWTSGSHPGIVHSLGYTGTVSQMLMSTYGYISSAFASSTPWTGMSNQFSQSTIDSSSSSPAWMKISGSLITTTAGNLSFEWCQFNNAGTTTVKKGSYIRAVRMLG